jgi:hypothetical protein
LLALLLTSILMQLLKVEFVLTYKLQKIYYCTYLPARTLNVIGLLTISW